MKIFSNHTSTSTDQNMVRRLKKQGKNMLFFIVLSAPAYLIFFTSCANQGVGPTGGPKDSIPPTILSCIPANLQTQFSGNEIEITFDEYVVIDNLGEKLIVSPPLGKKPTIRTKGKSVVVKMEEELIPDRTYTFDFGDGIKDYNEGNKLKNLRLIFSTGAQLDTLRISGTLYDASTLTPVPNAFATLYTSENDSSFKNLLPDFIARSDEKGFFLFDNLTSDNYKLYGIKDDDKNFYFSSASELIAFTDSMITPTAQYISKTDTIIVGKDTSFTHGYTVYAPADLTLLLFADDDYSQFMVSYKRETADHCLFTFNEPVTDSLQIKLIKNDSIQYWKEVEYSQNKDSVLLWITDSTLMKMDTLFFEVSYTVSDSLGEFVSQSDTLKMLFSKPKKINEEKKDSTENLFLFTSNLTSSNFDLNKKIIIEAPSPVETPGKEVFRLDEIVNDSTIIPVEYKLKAVDGSKRKFQVDFILKEATTYRLSVDSYAVKTLTGIFNAGFSSKFSTQKKDYYGSIILTVSGIEKKGIIQLIKNKKEEDLIREIPFDPKNKTITFDYLKPEKCLLKFIDDLNGNGKWDSGNLADKLPPEPVYYFDKEIIVKSNWEIKENWEIVPGMVKGKSIISGDGDSKKP